ncbi:DUF2946 family protein [Zavarzinia sp. CC-PAN008]|uniref:DUF2946 family protein n=1 Tax=Zavarzinia sp. CC-PAN008 TaxID=3243332 RepID=UPI003F74AA5D
MIATRACGARLFAWLLALALTAQLLLAPPIAMAMAAADSGAVAMANCPDHGADAGRGQGGHAGHDTCLLCQGGLCALAAVAADVPVLVLPLGGADAQMLAHPPGRAHSVTRVYRSRAPPTVS